MGQICALEEIEELYEGEELDLEDELAGINKEDLVKYAIKIVFQYEEAMFLIPESKVCRFLFLPTLKKVCIRDS